MSIRKVVQQAKGASPKDQLKHQAEKIEKLEQQLEHARSANFTLPTGKPRKSSKTNFIRLVIPDTHGCHIEHAWAKALFADLKRLNIKQVVMLGDHLECGNFLCDNHAMGYVAEVNDQHYTYEKDIAAANQFIDKVQELCFNAEIHYLEGNHERRVQRYCVTSAKKNKAENQYAEAQHMMRMYGTESVLHLQKRNIYFYQQGQYYMGLPLQAMIKLGKCHFVHGMSTAHHAAKAHLDKVGGNVVYGHTHRMDSYHSKTIGAGSIGAWSPGCGCNPQPLWGHQNFTQWVHGFGIQVVSSDGSFLHFNVPVIDGRSYLTLLIDKMK